MLSFIRMQHHILNARTHTHTKSRQECFKCYRFLLHVFWVIFVPFYLPCTRSLILSYPHQLSAKLFPLNLFVHTRDRDYNDRFFNSRFFLLLSFSFFHSILLLLLLLSSDVACFSQVNHKRNAFVVVKCMFYRAI